MAIWKVAALGLLALAGSLSCGGTESTPAADNPRSGGSGPRSITASPGLVIERACTPTGPELCFNARDDNCNGVLDEGCGIHTGLVQFSVAWTDAAADVDLNVTDPSGELVEVGRVSESGLVKERDCPGRRNECLGQSLENVYLEDGEPERGEYRVVVRLEKLLGAEPPVVVTLAARVGPKTYALEFELTRPEEERELILEL